MPGSTEGVHRLVFFHGSFKWEIALTHVSLAPREVRPCHQSVLHLELLTFVREGKSSCTVLLPPAPSLLMEPGHLKTQHLSSSLPSHFAVRVNEDPTNSEM